MDSALTPREIQSRIRAGESIEDVARAAGVPVDNIEGYAAPVLAEREHVAAQAQSAQVRRTEGPSTPISLSEAITPRLESKGIDPRSVLWDAWRDEDRADRHWTVRVSYQSGSAGHEALFEFDPRGRFASPVNADAQWLAGEQPPHKRPTPRPRTPTDPDTEPTVDLNDELALVRAVQDDETPTIAGGSALAELYAAAANNHTGPGGDGSAEGSLRETNGVYDIVSNPPSDMDVLYDMLSGFEEDSVHVYAGLDKPVHLGGAPSTGEQQPEPPDQDASTAQTAPSEHREPSPNSDIEEPNPAPAHSTEEPTAPPPQGKKSTRTHRRSATAPHAPGAGPAQPAASEPKTDSTQEAQKPLVEPGTSAGAAPHPKKSSRRRRTHRATVPTWDEIMFGGPRPDVKAPHRHEDD